MTKYEEAKAKHDIKRERVAAGLCIDCGAEPAAMNATTTSLGLRGENCKLKRKPPVPEKAESKPRRPDVLNEWDVADEFGYLDSDEFAEYAATCKGVIDDSPFAVSIGDMRLALGDRFNERRHADALANLVAWGEVRERQSGSLTRYEPAVRHERSTVEWGAAVYPRLEGIAEAGRRSV